MLQGDRVKIVVNSLINVLRVHGKLQFIGLEYYVTCPQQTCGKQSTSNTSQISTDKQSKSSDTIVIVLISVAATVVAMLIAENIGMCMFHTSRRIKVCAETLTLPEDTIPVEVSSVDDSQFV